MSPAKETEEMATRVVAKFTWALVNPGVVRSLLEARGIDAYGISGQKLRGGGRRAIRASEKSRHRAAGLAARTRALLVEASARECLRSFEIVELGQ